MLCICVNSWYICSCVNGDVGVHVMCATLDMDECVYVGG